MVQFCNRLIYLFSSLSSLYPYIALKNKFVVGAGIHLLGEKKLALLTLDYGQGCFVYQDPLQGTLQECDGIIRCQIGVDRMNHSVNQLPFLPVRIKEDSVQNKTYRIACLKCLQEKHEGLCPHDMSKRVWTDTYTCVEVAYAVTKLNYKLIAIKEALVYPHQAYIFSDFMKILASKKIKYGAVPQQYQDNLSQYCQEVNQAMGFENEMDQLTPETLDENPYQCSFIKGLMNMGKDSYCFTK